MNHYQQIKEEYGPSAASTYMKYVRSYVKKPTGFAAVSKEVARKAQLKSAKKRVQNAKKKRKQLKEKG